MACRQRQAQELVSTVAVFKLSAGQGHAPQSPSAAPAPLTLKKPGASKLAAPKPTAKANASDRDNC